MIWWHGVSSDDVQVIVERFPNINVPARKQEKVSVPGRNGDVLIQEDAFENVVQRYEIHISAEQAKLPRIARMVKEWLCVKGYQRLEDSYFLDSFRLANFAGSLEIENILNRFGRAAIEFDCKPQRFLHIGEDVTTYTGAGIIINPTPFASAPLIKVNGSGSGTVTIGDTTVSLTDISEYVMLDCDIQDAYKGIVNKNSTMTGSFPKIEGGEQVVSFTGGITSLEITPRWWTL